MPDMPTLPGIETLYVDTARLRQRLLACGPLEGLPALLIHGNLAAATFFEELMLGLASHGYRCLAPDLRGHGWSEAKPIHAIRGYRDFVDDLAELAASQGLGKLHIVGWGLGGAVALRYTIDHLDQVLSLTLQAPISPFGFGGTRDARGTLCYDDCAGSGGGIVNPQFAKRLADGDRRSDDPGAPRDVMNAFFFKPPFRAAREEDLLTAALREVTGTQFYPGDFVPSIHWPHVTPGAWGPVNASAPVYVRHDVADLLALNPKPPILWIRGADDQVISDNSLFDPGALGKLGILPGWPGEDLYPPQPMLAQTRAILEDYAAAGGTYREVVFDDCGHTPHIEFPACWQETFISHTKTERTGGWLAT